MKLKNSPSRMWLFTGITYLITAVALLCMFVATRNIRLFATILPMALVGVMMLILAFAFGKKTHKEMCRMTGQNPADTIEDERTDLLRGKAGFFTWGVQMAVFVVCYWIAFALRIAGIITSFVVPVLMAFMAMLHGMLFLFSYLYYQKRY